jgi:hypothetical protein
LVGRICDVQGSGLVRLFHRVIYQRPRTIQ